MFKMAVRFVLYYRMQSFAILLSMTLSIALLTGISSLVYSGQKSDLENCREIYGDWNCKVPYTEETAEKLAWKDTPGYRIEKCGKYALAEQIKEKEQAVQIMYADAVYLEMMDWPVVSGDYPKEDGEIAMNQFTMDNLEIDAAPGQRVTLGGTCYRLSGILKNPWASDSLMMTAFVSSSAVSDADMTICLKLDDSQNMYQQVKALARDLDVPADSIVQNSYVNKYLGQNGLQNMVQAVQNTLSGGEYNFTYLLLVLKDEFGLTVNGIIFGLGLFCLFIIYSIYQINLSKRISVYGILNALGVSRTGQFVLALAELWILLMFGFPAGAFLGNVCAKALYHKYNTVFIDTEVVSSSHGDLTKRYEEAARLSVQGFSVSQRAVLFGLVFLSAAMVLLAWRMAVHIEKMTVIQMIKPKAGSVKHKKDIIYSQKGCYMPGVVNWKFMFAGRRSLAGILVSLSIGGVVFLCAAFVMGNAKADSQMKLASDDGLGSDFKIYENNKNLNQVISQDTVDALGQIQGIRNLYAVKSYIGETLLRPDELLWKDYFKGINQDFGEPWNGVCRELADGGYAVKTNIFGYDDALLKQLAPYQIGEGSLTGGLMRNYDQVVLVTLEDAQGNHNGIASAAGDTIRLRVPKKLEGSSNDLKMSGGGRLYEEKEFTICAVVSRPLIRDNMLYHLEWVNMDAGLDVIMTQEQMAWHFGVEGYRTAGMELEPGADTQKTAQMVKQEISGINSLIFQDYTGSIERQNEYLKQKMFFFSSVAVMFFVISLVHIVNAVSHIVLSRKHEFGVLRAVGTTDRNIVGMMAGQGFVYGCLSCVVMMGLFFAARKIAVYFMVHVYGFLICSIEVRPAVFLTAAGVNIAVSILAVLLPAYMVLKEEIIPQVNA